MRSNSLLPHDISLSQPYPSTHQYAALVRCDEFQAYSCITCGRVITRQWNDDDECPRWTRWETSTIHWPPRTEEEAIRATETIAKWRKAYTNEVYPDSGHF